MCTYLIIEILIKGDIQLIDNISEPVFLGLFRSCCVMREILWDVLLYGCISTHMTISLRVELLEMYAMASFSSSMGSVAFTMFWNMVRFLHTHTHNTISPLMLEWSNIDSSMKQFTRWRERERAIERHRGFYGGSPLPIPNSRQSATHLNQFAAKL